ncbi:MAG: hypothetical protein KAU48_04385 [Candidatus Thorarchaeota archaeon]|nr:hypothetical protein [Candidatus Thorarchaeota archaeon]
MSDKSLVDSKNIVRLNKKIDEIQCVLQIIIVLIILIFVTQIFQIIESPDDPLYGWSSISIIIIAVFFLLGAICIICNNDNQKSIESPKQKKESGAPAGI